MPWNISGGEIEFGSHVEYFAPAALDGFDIVEIVQLDRALISKSRVGSEEVVVSDEEDSESDSAVEVFEAAAGAGVELVSAVESFNDLLELSVFGAFLVLIFQADDSSSFKGEGSALEHSGVVDCEDGRVIGRVTIADELSGSVLGRRSDGFLESDEGIACSSGIREVIGMDSARGCADGEPSVIPLVYDADI